MSNPDRLLHRIEAVESRIPPPPEKFDWYGLLAESRLEGQNRRCFEHFIATCLADKANLQELSDDELFTLERFVLLGERE